MIEMSMQIHGLAAMKEALRILPDEAKIKALRPSVGQMGKLTLSKAKAKVPVDTGSIRDNIRLVRASKDFPWREVFGLRVKTARRLTKRLGFMEGTKKGEKLEGKRDPYYWFFVEFGTAKKSARPFLRPALDAHREEHVAEFRAGFTKRLILVVRKIHGKQRAAALRTMSRTVH